MQKWLANLNNFDTAVEAKEISYSDMFYNKKNNLLDPMEHNLMSSSSATAEKRVAGNHVKLILPLMKLFVISGKNLGSLHVGVFQI